MGFGFQFDENDRVSFDETSGLTKKGALLGQKGTSFVPDGKSVVADGGLKAHGKQVVNAAKGIVKNFAADGLRKMAAEVLMEDHNKLVDKYLADPGNESLRKAIEASKQKLAAVEHMSKGFPGVAGIAQHGFDEGQVRRGLDDLQELFDASNLSDQEKEQLTKEIVEYMAKHQQPFTQFDLALDNLSGELVDKFKESIGWDGCFLAGTPIAMADGTEKAIEHIKPGDRVLSYDRRGDLKAGRVIRTMTHTARQILDVHGLMVTPGHVTLCGDGDFAGRHVPIIDILRSDGALVREDGQLVRAGTGCGLGSMGDRMVHAVAGEIQSNGEFDVREAGRIRLGTRFITENGDDLSVMDLIFSAGGMLTDDGYIKADLGGEKKPFRWPFGSALPKPEDYILQRSATTTADIYRAGEWEGMQPQMAMNPSEASGDIASGQTEPFQPGPVNTPLSMRGDVYAQQPATTGDQRAAVVTGADHGLAKGRLH